MDYEKMRQDLDDILDLIDPEDGIHIGADLKRARKLVLACLYRVNDALEPENRGQGGASSGTK